MTAEGVENREASHPLWTPDSPPRDPPCAEGMQPWSGSTPGDADLGSVWTFCGLVAVTCSSWQLFTLQVTHLCYAQ